jgi:hypothetical protein
MNEYRFLKTCYKIKNFQRKNIKIYKKIDVPVITIRDLNFIKKNKIFLYYNKIIKNKFKIRNKIRICKKNKKIILKSKLIIPNKL